MRIDKYLKCTRLIKRRTVAKEILDEGNILLNERVAKPSSEVKPGDEICLLLGRRKITIRVKDCAQVIKKSQAEDLYEMVSCEVIIPEESA